MPDQHNNSSKKTFSKETLPSKKKPIPMPPVKKPKK